MALDIEDVAHSVKSLLKDRKFEDALELVIKYEKSISEEGNGLATLLSIKGVIYKHQNELNDSLDSHLKSLEIRRKVNNEKGVANSLNNISIVYRLKGDLENALKYQNECLEIRTTLADQNDIAASLNNLGVIYNHMGNLNQALNFFTQSLELNQEIGDLKSASSILHNIGVIHQTQGNHDQSHNYFTQSLGISKEIDDPNIIAQTLFTIVRTNLAENNHNAVNEAVMQLDALDQEYEDNSVIEYIYKLSKAAILKTENDMRSKMDSLSILEELIVEKISNFELLVFTIKYYFELLMTKFKFYKDIEILEVAKDQLDELQKLAVEQESYSLLVETWILQSKLAMIEGNLEGAKLLIDQATQTAAEKGLRMLEIHAELEKYSFYAQYDQWNAFLDQFSPSGIKVDDSQILDYISSRQSIPVEELRLISDDDVGEILEIVEKEESFLRDQISDQESEIDELKAQISLQNEEIKKLTKKVSDLELELTTELSLKQSLEDKLATISIPPEEHDEIIKEEPEVSSDEEVVGDEDLDLQTKIVDLLNQTKSKRKRLRSLSMGLGISPIACESAIKNLESKGRLSIKKSNEEDLNPWITLEV